MTKQVNLGQSNSKAVNSRIKNKLFWRLDPVSAQDLGHGLGHGLGHDLGHGLGHGWGQVWGESWCQGWGESWGQNWIKIKVKVEFKVKVKVTCITWKHPELSWYSLDSSAPASLISLPWPREAVLPTSGFEGWEIWALKTKQKTL